MAFGGKKLFPNWTRIEWLAFLVLLCLGLADAVLRIVIMGWSRGLHYCLHDPAKVLFHIVILPIAVVLLLRRTPPARLAAYVRTWPTLPRRLVLPFAGLIVVAGMVGTFWNDRDWRCGQMGAYLLPQDVFVFHDPIVKHDVQQLDSLRVLYYCHLLGNPTCRLQPADTHAIKATYREITARHQENCAQYPFTSAYNLVAFVETLAAVATVAYVFISVLLLAVHRRLSGEAVSSTGLLTPVALITPWILMRAYSDLYINFIEGVTPAIYIMAVVLILFILLEYTIEKEPRQAERIQAIYGMAVGAIVLAVGFFGQLEASFRLAFQLGPWLQILIFLLVLSPSVVWVSEQLYRSSHWLGRSTK